MQEPTFMTGPGSYSNCMILYDSGCERHTKRIVYLLQAKDFEPVETQETLMEASVRLPLVRETSNDSLR